jgi:signal transduction histidine kinase
VPVEGDAAKVQRIAQNLLLNAFKATERGGIRITWHEEDGTPGCRHWTLCVQDTGIGFDPTQAALLNVALKQATGTAHDLNQSAKAGDQVRSAGATSTALHTDSKGGEGIGLSIVKRLCELLDARLELESAPGHGATFRVTFPRTYVD